MRWLVVVCLVLAACDDNDVREKQLDEAMRALDRAKHLIADAAPAPPRYEIAFPAASKVSETSVQTARGPMHQRIETAQLDGTTYIVVSGVMPDGLPSGNHAGGIDRMLAMFDAHSTRDVAIKLGDITGREVRFAGAATGILRTFDVASWEIQAGVLQRGGAVDERAATRFLDSLKILQPGGQMQREADQ